MEVAYIGLVETSELEVVSGINVSLDGDGVLKKLQELRLKLVNLIIGEEWVDEREVSVREILVIPNLKNQQINPKNPKNPKKSVFK